MLEILMIDNYDSFTYNLVQYFEELGVKVLVFKNDEIKLEDVQKFDVRGIVISPGPCTPKEAGISVDIIKYYSGKLPILGVCLGHQSIGYAFGANIIKASKIMHGKSSFISHTGENIFSSIKNPFGAIRYHSLVIDKNTLPKELKVSAVSEDDKEIMGIYHKDYPTFGVQFHPESIMSEEGKKILGNFLDIVKSF